MTLAIECSQLCKTYAGNPPVDAVRGIDLQVNEGECFGVLGPNGAGKTTTIEILEGLLEATSGEAHVLGRSWKDQAAEIREDIGISLQETRLSEKLTITEILRLFASFYQDRAEPADVIARVSLQDKANSRLKTLSGGQRQRVAVATALVGNPKLLFLDEPTTGLDPTSRRELWEIINSFRDAGGTVMLTTHYMDEAERLCDRVAIFDHGQVLETDTPKNLIAGLGADHVVEFAVEPLSDATSEQGRAGGAEVSDDYCSDLPGVLGAGRDAGMHRLVVEQPHVAISALINRLSQDQLGLTSLTTRTATLEDVFVNLTGRHLDDDEADDA